MLYDSYLIKFNFKRELEKCFMVQKKTKNRNSIHFIPKSIILESEDYIKEKVYKDIDYSYHRMDILLPAWFVKKELGFYS